MKKEARCTVTICLLFTKFNDIKNIYIFTNRPKASRLISTPRSIRSGSSSRRASRVTSVAQRRASSGARRHISCAKTRSSSALAPASATNCLLKRRRYTPVGEFPKLLLRLCLAISLEVHKRNDRNFFPVVPSARHIQFPSLQSTNAAHRRAVTSRGSTLLFVVILSAGILRHPASQSKSDSLCNIVKCRRYAAG